MIRPKKTNLAHQKMFYGQIKMVIEGDDMYIIFMVEHIIKSQIGKYIY